MAATNEEVDADQFPILVGVFSAVILLCLITFRSVRVTVCIIVPLSIVSVLCYALMSVLGIGLKTNTLPVAALGVGVGVDYGIYIFSRVVTAMREGADLPEAYLQTLRTTGAAVLVTGLTLAIGVSTWVFSALKFQADMGLLLSFMFLANMLGALLLLPSMAFFILPRKKN
jgi:predicted RND superfamily exporter protein